MNSQKGFSIAMPLALLLGLIAVVAIASAYYFIDKERNNSFEKNMLTLNVLQQLDAKWSEDILKTRSYTLQDFDQLALGVVSIREALASLDKQGMSDKKLVGKKTVKQYQIYKHSFATKNAAVENYKSQQAILRNSVRFLPEAGKMAQRALNANEAQEVKLFSKLLNTSKLLMNQFLLGVSAIEEVRDSLLKLEVKSVNLNPDIETRVRDFIIHSQLIIKHKPKVDSTLKTAMSIDIATLSKNLINEYINSQDVVKNRIKQLQQVMLAGVALLLLLLLWFLLRLRKSTTKILNATTKNKDFQQQLLETEKHIKQVDENLVEVEQQSASGQLSLNTFKQLNTIMPALAIHIEFLKELKTNKEILEHENEMDLLITDMNDLYSNIHQLGCLIDPKKNKNNDVSFDFNHVIQSAFDTVSSEVDPSVPFNKNLSAMPMIKASSTDLYQITTKLLEQSAKRWKKGDERIFVKTWAAGHYASLCLSISGLNSVEDIYAETTLSDLKGLIEKNSAVLKVTPRKEAKSSVIWVSFPYRNK